MSASSIKITAFHGTTRARNAVTAERENAKGHERIRSVQSSNAVCTLEEASRAIELESNVGNAEAKSRSHSHAHHDSGVTSDTKVIAASHTLHQKTQHDHFSSTCLTDETVNFSPRSGMRSCLFRSCWVCTDRLVPGT